MATLKNLQHLLAQLTYELAHQQETDSLQTTIIELLQNQPNETAEFLLSYIPYSSETLRPTLVWALGFVASEAHLPFLLHLLQQDPSPAVRISTLETLANFPQNREVRLAFISTLQYDSDQQIRLTAQRILAHIYHSA